MMNDASRPAPTVSVVIVAAGMGTRLGAGIPKAFVRLGSYTLLEWALRGAVSVPRVTEVVVVVSRDMLDAATAVVWGPLPGGIVPPAGVALRVVEGGAERVDSVRCGVQAAQGDLVLVHDCARCLTPVSVFDRVIDALAAGAEGAVPGLPVVDTLKSVQVCTAADRDAVPSETLVVTATLPRASLRAIQTPQGAWRKTLLEAFDHIDAALAAGEMGPSDVTDDASVLEAAGRTVVVVDGDERALKVTVPSDLLTAQRYLAEAGAAAGTGAVPRVHHSHQPSAECLTRSQ